VLRELGILNVRESSSGIWGLHRRFRADFWGRKGDGHAAQQQGNRDREGRTGDADGPLWRREGARVHALRGKEAVTGQRQPRSGTHVVNPIIMAISFVTPGKRVLRNKQKKEGHDMCPWLQVFHVHVLVIFVCDRTNSNCENEAFD
jgi:hypothetical protein